MNVAQVWSNIVAYALQIGLLVGVGALVPTLLRLRTPRARLLYWQALLVACLILPWVQPWRQEVISLSNGNVLTTNSSPVASPVPPVVAATPRSQPPRIPFTEIVLWLLAGGIGLRLAWLNVGLIRLAGYRRRGCEMASDPVFRMATPGSARWLVSDEIPSPVTFGWRDPVVLLPARFPSLRAELREAILCHELIHVERRDWTFTVAEELVRAVLWFHPAIWWVLGEIQLAREQTVDLAVIEITHAREPYVDALLAMAGAVDGNAGSLDLAPAPLFLRKRHLKQRVIGLLEEVRVSPLSRSVSNIRLVLTHAGAAATIAGACWIASGAFPLSAEPQFVTDGVGVIVNTGDAKLVHRVSVTYPLEALEKGVEGHIVVQASVNNDGTLSDKTLVQCPRELCAGAVDSLSQWQFDRREASSTRAISIDFVRPAGAPLPPVDDPKAALRFSLAVAGQGRKPSRTGALGLSSARTLLAQTIRPLTPGVTAFPTVAQAARGVPTFVTRTVWMNGAYVSLLPPSVTTAQGHALNEIRIAGLSDSDWNQLSSRLPVHAGDVWSAATASIVSQVVMDFNPRMEVDLVNYPGQQQWGLWIGPAAREQNRSVMAPAPLPPGVYTAGNGVTPPTVISKYDPVYSDSARNAGVSGTVTLSVVVGSDGAPQNILVVGSLDPGLDQAAADALAKWRFRPGTKEGAPVSVQARVEMSFRVL